VKYWNEEHVQKLDFKMSEIILPLGGFPARRGLLLEFDIPKKLIEVEIVPNSEQDADVSNQLTGDVVRMHCAAVETRIRGLEYGAPWKTFHELVPFMSLRLTSIPKGYKEDPFDAYDRAMSII